MRIYLTFLTMGLLIPAVAAAQYEDAPPPARPEYSPIDSPDAPTAGDTDSLHGVELSFGLGFGLPMGDIMKSSYGSPLALGDVIGLQLPIQVGLGYRIDPRFRFAMTFQYAPLSTKDCDSGSSCAARDMRLAVEGRVHSRTGRSFTPWLAVGLGYEWLTLSYSGNGSSGDATTKGVDFNVQVGGGARVSPTLTVGPFVDLRFGKYDSVSGSSSSGSGEGDIPSDHQTTHMWLTLGVRGMFAP
jgi:opacity protein-like surface antigen